MTDREAPPAQGERDTEELVTDAPPPVIPRDARFENAMERILGPVSNLPDVALVEVIEQVGAEVTIRPQGAPGMEPFVATASRGLAADPGDLAVAVQRAGTWFVVSVIADPEDVFTERYALADHQHPGSAADSFQIGKNANAAGSRSVAFGRESYATGSESSAYGSFSAATADEATAIGHFATASEIYTTAIGAEAEARGDRAIAVGIFARALGIRSVAVGRNSHVPEGFTDSIAIGNQATVTASNQMMLGMIHEIVTARGKVQHEIKAAGMTDNAVGTAFNTAGTRTHADAYITDMNPNFTYNIFLLTSLTIDANGAGGGECYPTAWIGGLNETMGNGTVTTVGYETTTGIVLAQRQLSGITQIQLRARSVWFSGTVRHRGSTVFGIAIPQ